MDADHEGVRLGARGGRPRRRWCAICPAHSMRRWNEDPGALAPSDENLTVLKGTFLVAVGETFDESKLQTMNVGNFIQMPKEMRHFAMNKGETIVQLHGQARSR